MLHGNPTAKAGPVAHVGNVGIDDRHNRPLTDVRPQKGLERCHAIPRSTTTAAVGSFDEQNWPAIDLST